MPFLGVDTFSIIGPTEINVLLENNVFWIGRYLRYSGGISFSEAQLLSSNDIRIVSIIQTYGNLYENCTVENARMYAAEAVASANSINQPPYTYIFFGLDYDYSLAQWNNRVRDFFNEIVSYMSSGVNNPNHYRVGLYSRRSVCGWAKDDHPEILTWSSYATGSYVGPDLEPDISQISFNTLISHNEVNVLVDLDEMKNTKKCFWKYETDHPFFGSYTPLDKRKHIRQCSSCGCFEVENHIPNASGTACTVCGFQGHIPVFPNE